MNGSNQKLYKLKESFLEAWPLERVEEMSLSEYTNIKREDSFTYWVESKTRPLGSIKGGTSYKFGIYKRDNVDKEDSRDAYLTDGEYAWVGKYGSEKQEAFSNVKKLVIEVVKAVKNNNLSKIDTINLGNAYKWKIAFLYSDFEIINVFKTDALLFLAEEHGVQGYSRNKISPIHEKLKAEKPSDEDYFEYTNKLWKSYEDRASSIRYWAGACIWGEGSEKVNKTSEFIENEYWETGYDMEDGEQGSKIFEKLQEVSVGDKIALRNFTRNQNKIEVTALGTITGVEEVSDGKLDIEWYETENLYEGSKPSGRGAGNWWETFIEVSRKKDQELLFDLDGDETMETKSSKNKLTDEKPDLNQILFGPPGTGKTYHTVNKAIQIVDPDYYEKYKDERKKLTERFRELLITDWDKHRGRQIASTTFHQSFTYEDFIEGIKPKIVEEKEKGDSSKVDDEERKGEIAYEIQAGIFKKICELARQDSGGEVARVKNSLKMNQEEYKKAEFFKYSGDLNVSTDKLYHDCIKDSRIYFSYLNGIDLTNREEKEIVGLCKSEDLDTDECKYMAIFKHHVDVGDYVFFTNSNQRFKAIGIVTGEYEFDEDSSYPHSRKVDWIVSNVDLGVDLIYNQNFRGDSIYQLSKKEIKTEFFASQDSVKETPAGKKPYVLIIDEINRGNIAQIFGELITLIEEDKREGMDEEMKASLPYSKHLFSVPSNLHIIGTMNTADRSIEALDTALRRRFTFQEMPPKPEVIEEEGHSNVIKFNDEEVKLTDLLKKINERIEKLLDKDHLIGHSYFMKVSKVYELRNTFQKNIIPLLEEYFYGDKGKIQMILGRGFIERSTLSDTGNVFAESDYEGASLMDEREVWKMKGEWKSNDDEGDKYFGEALQTLIK